MVRAVPPAVRPEPAAGSPEKVRYWRLHQPSRPEEERTFTHSALESSSTVSVSPMGSVVRTLPLMLAASRRFR